MLSIRIRGQQHTLGALMIVWMRVRRDGRRRHRRAWAAVGRGRVRAGRRLHVRLGGCAGKRISSMPSRSVQRGRNTYVASDPSRGSTSLFPGQTCAKATRGVEGRTIWRSHSRRVGHLHVRTLHVRAWGPRGRHTGHHVLHSRIDHNSEKDQQCCLLGVGMHMVGMRTRSHGAAAVRPV